MTEETIEIEEYLIPMKVYLSPDAFCKEGKNGSYLVSAGGKVNIFPKGSLMLRYENEDNPDASQLAQPQGRE